MVRFRGFAAFSRQFPQDFATIGEPTLHLKRTPSAVYESAHDCSAALLLSNAYFLSNILRKIQRAHHEHTEDHLTLQRSLNLGEKTPYQRLNKGWGTFLLIELCYEHWGVNNLCSLLPVDLVKSEFDCKLICIQAYEQFCQNYHLAPP